jgi:hypothetical protein
LNWSRHGLQVLNNVIIETKVIFPQVYVTMDDLAILLMHFCFIAPKII